MKDLRERCKYLLDEISYYLAEDESYQSHVDEVESFAREIASQARQEALEECIMLTRGVTAAKIRELKYKDPVILAAKGNTE